MNAMAQLAGTRFPYSVLLVDQSPLFLQRLVKPLREAGCDVFAVTTFEEAKQRLAGFAPDLLIAASRLGEFNGLHLVLRGHLDHPEMAAILIAPAKDPILEAEATHYGASCVVAPETSDELLALVSQAVGAIPMAARF
jgi:PleD family two-component response regulator